MMSVSKSIVLTAISAMLFGASTSHAQPIHLDIFDFDGTLVENRQVREGTFNPKVVLYRIEQRLNLIQTEAQGPKSITITYQDLHKISEYLGAGEGQPGSVKREVELSDGTRIRPGEYYLRLPDSFQFFREAPLGSKRNYLLETMIEAEAKGPEGQWKGPLWQLFSELTQTKEGAERIAIITARGHSRTEWTEFLDYMVKKKHIKFKPSLDRIYNVTRPEFDRYNGAGGAHGGELVDIPARKANLVREILNSLGRVDPGPGLLHSVFFADDEAKNHERVARVFQDVAFANRTPVRMILVNAGLESQVRESDHYKFTAIEPAGSFKSLANIENLYTARGVTVSAEALTTKPAPKKVLRTCENLFLGAM